MSKNRKSAKPTFIQATPLIIFEIVIGCITSLLSFLIFIKISTEVVGKEVFFLDTAISHLIYSLRTPLLNTIMRGITMLGGEMLVIGAIAAAVFFLLKGYKREAILFSSTIIVGYLLNHSLKYLFQVPRPDIDPIYLEHFYSFPSGHAMNSFIFYISFAYFFFHFTRNIFQSILLLLVAGTLVILIGFSRIYLGVHYPSDILAGFIAGFWWIVTVIVIDKTLYYFGK